MSSTPWPYGPVGLVLAGEEHSAGDLLALGCAAEAKGFSFAFVSDHFHPWNFQQGHSSYVWAVLGALAAQTRHLALVSAVTCPILRIHPTTLAQAASTVYHLSGGRFILGLGSGENLNEHIQGQGWPGFQERLDRLEEAVAMLRQLLSGKEVTAQGRYFQVEAAQLFDAAPELRIFLASSGPLSTQLARRFADGLICLGSQAELASRFGPARPRLIQLSVCWAPSQKEAERTAHQYFPEVAMPGTLFAQLKTPAEFSRAAMDVSIEDVAASIVCGPDPSLYRAAIEDCLEAGFDGVALHQIGPEQRGFLDFWQRELRGEF